MSNMNTPNSGLVDTFGALVSSDTNGTSVSAGAYSQITAATTREYEGFYLSTYLESMSTATDNLSTLDIAMGAGAAEKILIDKLKFNDYFTGQSNGMPFGYIPIRIPRGVRLAVRQNTTSGSTDSRVAIHPCSYSPFGNRGFTRAESMGVTGNKGVEVDAGATPNTKGSYSQIIASTSNRYQAIMLCISSDNQRAQNGSERFAIDIAVGAAASEKVIVNNLLCTWSFSNGATILPWCFGPFPCDIPAGSRLAVRAQNSAATVTKFDATLYGFMR